jgi:hypothetical protein
MNGFDQFASSETGASGAERAEPLFPTDFTQDEELFASELRNIFDIEREDLPSGYVPTILGYERHAPAQPGFERRVTRRVFRELNLPSRPLFERNAIFQFGAALTEPIQQLRHAGRAAIGVLSSVMLVMVMSMVFATPSFADGLQILLGHTGVQQVADYPRNVHNSELQKTQQGSQHETPTPLYWMGQNVANYSYLGMRTLPKEVWSKGQVVDLQYVLTDIPAGSGVLDVRMFQIADDYQAVLKVVQTGSAREIKSGDTWAIYVDGTWMAHGRHQFWQSGVRSELLFEKNGVIFWITGDQRDGAGEAQLLAAASKITAATSAELLVRHLTIGSAGGELQSLFHDPMGEEVYKLIPRGADGNSTGQLVSFPSPYTAPQLDAN